MGVYNQGGGLLPWNISVTYKSGDGWLRVSPASGLNTATVRVDAVPEKLSQGTYQAVLTVDAGPLAGTSSFDVRFVVTPPAPPVLLRPLIGGVTNAASALTAPLVAGSLATVWGTHFQGRMVLVTFDGVPAQIFFINDTQINLLVPPEVLSRKIAQVAVTVDGTTSSLYTATLADAAPAIFPNGILNQDNSVNSPASPAPPGSVIQVFATGLLSSQVFGVVARMDDHNIAFPAYFGPAPGFIGLHQVNLAVPGDLPAMTTPVFVCALTIARPESPLCSPPVPLVIGAK
jgi:uncharacterized protein (TIGR03437 family)